MFSLLLLLSVAGPRFVFGQIAQTNATCTSDYSWMGNSKGDSPCLVVAELDAQCNFGSWSVVALNGANAYANPLGQYAQLCTCSWASYNLISACTACQGYAAFIAVWGDYIAGCTGNTTNNSYWPPSIAIPTDVKIPYWASTNPTTWTDARFSPADAKTIYQASHPDLPTATSQSKSSSSTPTGAIVGGVIGGLVVIGFFIAVCLCLIRRPRQNPAHPGDRLAHMRKMSDLTVTSGNVTLADSSSLRPTVRTASTSNVQRNTSVSSLPFFSSLISRDSRVGAGQSGPADPVLPPIEEVITPYTLPPTNETPEKRQRDEWPVFDQPSAPPQNTVRMMVTPSATPAKKTGTNRYNPPAYSEADTTTPLSPTMSRHQAQGSMDSALSTPMATEASDSTVRRGGHTPANSSSSLGHMGLSNPIRASTSTFHTMQTSVSTRRTSLGQVSAALGGFGRTLFMARSLDGLDHEEERTEDGFSPSEIA